jgi:hypothetical protein
MKVLSVALTITALTVITSCSSLNSRKVEFKLEKSTLEGLQSSITKESVVESRSSKYIKCLSKLNREGIKQGLLKSLCDSAYGSIDE